MPVSPAPRSLANEDGFTLPELLTGMVIAMIVLLAAFQTLDRVITTTGDSQRRVEANQRGRIAMDDVVRQLRSQTCLTTAWAPASQPPIVVRPSGPTTTAPTADGTQSVAFYADTQRTAALQSSAVVPPELRVLRFDGAASTLSLDVYRPTVTTAGTVRTATYPATPTRRSRLLSNVHRDGSTPVFRFFTYNAAATPPQPTTPVSPWTSGAATVSKMNVTFDVWPTDATSARNVSAALTTDVFVREVDPNDSSRVPNCQ